ncbi:hypothetical protein PSH97_17640 [Pseudomonas cucumis]|uniref:SMODS and SLOG-associating 2TM effector domain-containing protein n=1 Tax=Pseudomonas cucumis TaxID=2954082 RepID=A0ABY9ESJ5_9PSED|nr:hypothetical protein [Pseudomonas cucumis]WLG82941.1 hypothetical protein PSH97_17640 [Pseudomonas cucumis]
MNLDFYREIHEKEFRRKDSLAQRASAIITCLTTLGGVAGFIVMNYKRSIISVDVAFWFFAAASIVMLLIASFWLVQSYRVPVLQDIDRPTEWMLYWKELALKYTSEKGAFNSAEEEFKDHLMNSYADIGSANIDANDKKAVRLNRGNNAVLAAFAFLIIDSLVYYYSNGLLKDYLQVNRGEQMFNLEKSFICIPALEAGNSVNRPGPRPVPGPSPSPKPPPSELHLKPAQP